METQAENKVSAEQPELDKVLEKINEIAKKSADGDYIYRGEPECYCKVSSTLYRVTPHIEELRIVLKDLQDAILKEAKTYIGQTDDIDATDDIGLLTDIQHFGGKTNLIDFTEDYLIALFFACDGSHEEDGRVILLKRASDNYEIREPRRTNTRVESQKSIFVESNNGFVTPDIEVIIPANLKHSMLNYLEKYHRISIATIYNDLHGFIRRSAHTELVKALTCQYKASKAKTDKEKDDFYDNAIKHYTEALKLEFDTKAWVYYNRGIAYANTGKIDRAVQDFTQVIALNPKFADAYYNRGNVHSIKGEYDKAIRDYTQVIALNPKFADAYYNRGTIYSNKGEFAEAIKDFNKAIDLNPKDAGGYSNRGNAYDEIGEFAEAIKDFNKAIDLNPEDARFYYNRGVAYGKTGEFEAAIADFNKAIDLNPEDARGYNGRGVAYGKIGEFEAAIADFNKAIDLAPEDAGAYNNRGLAYRSKGEFNAAIQDYNKAIEVNPEHASAYYNKGEAWLHLKEWEKAKADLTTAKEMGNDIIESFQNDYESVEDFEAKNKVKMPKDIAALFLQAKRSSRAG